MYMMPRVLAPTLKKKEKKKKNPKWLELTAPNSRKGEAWLGPGIVTHRLQTVRVVGQSYDHNPSEELLHTSPCVYLAGVSAAQVSSRSGAQHTGLSL